MRAGSLDIYAHVHIRTHIYIRERAYGEGVCSAFNDPLDLIALDRRRSGMKLRERIEGKKRRRKEYTVGTSNRESLACTLRVHLRLYFCPGFAPRDP